MLNMRLENVRVYRRGNTYYTYGNQRRNAEEQQNMQASVFSGSEISVLFVDLFVEMTLTPFYSDSDWDSGDDGQFKILLPWSTDKFLTLVFSPKNVTGTLKII